ncbi:hypothetical protein KFQ04_22765 [Pseudomonas synxantha]|nr:hypothetical protein KFQ04_22765 [Pseudomonas synxantha]
MLRQRGLSTKYRESSVKGEQQTQPEHQTTVGLANGVRRLIRPHEVIGQSGAKALQAKRVHVEFRNVGFSYGAAGDFLAVEYRHPLWPESLPEGLQLRQVDAADLI